MEGSIGSRVRNIRRRESFFPLIRFVPGSCFGCLLLTSPPARVAESEHHQGQTPDQCRPGHHGYIVEATGRHWSVVRRSPRPPAPRAQAVVSRSSSRFFPGRHCDRSSSFHLEISRAPEAGAMPAYILKVLAPAAQSFIRHSHATLPSAACSPISHFSPKIRKFGGESQNFTAFCTTPL